MGTSKSYQGPTGKNPLLPPWAPPAPGEEAPSDTGAPPAQTSAAPTSWTGPKRDLGRLVSSGTRRPDADPTLRRIGRGFVSALGGARSAASSAASGRSSTQRLGQFLATAATRGVSEAARTFGLAEYLGQDVAVFLTRLVDALAPAGALIEQAVARAAMAETLTDLVDQYLEEGRDLGALEELSREQVGEILGCAVVHYINERLLQALASRIEDGTITPERACVVERDVCEFVDETTRLDLAAVDVFALDWGGPDGQAFVGRIYEDAFRFLEAEE